MEKSDLHFVQDGAVSVLQCTDFPSSNATSKNLPVCRPTKT